MDNHSIMLDKQLTNKLATWSLLVGIVLMASNMRSPLTSVGPLIPFIRDDLNISNALAGMITTLPLIAFALLSPFIPKIANRMGMERTVFLSLVLLTAGIFVRSISGTILLFIGTVFIGLAIAIGNVLLPAIVKMKFPLKIGLMTGIYAVSMNLFGALASGLSVPIASTVGLGWKTSLALWGILAVVALILWIPQLRHQADTAETVQTELNETKPIWKYPLAWFITLFMGIQSFIYYTSITWIPEILQSYGYHSNTAGWMVSLMQFALIPITFIFPVMAERLANQRILSAISGLSFCIGVAGVLLAYPFFIPVAMILIGIGAGSAFTLSMMFFSLRTTSAKQASEMSGMAQAVGYLLAALGPVTFGALYDLTNGWQVPLLILVMISIIFTVIGLEAGKDQLIPRHSNNHT